MTHPAAATRPRCSYLLPLLLPGLLALPVAVPAGAQEPAPAAGESAAEEPATEPAEAAPVTATQAQAFLGYWLLDVQLGQGSRKFGLHIDDRGDDRGRDGDELSGELVSGFGEMTAEKFAMKDGALAFDLASSVGRFRVEIRLEGNELRGVFGDTAGQMRAEFTGERSDRLGLLRFMMPGDESRITRGEQMVRLRFVSPPAGGPDFEQIESAEPGQVVRFLEEKAIKLTTDLPLVFGSLDGSLEVPTENVAPDYPGVYSLWLKRTAAGWSLVFNHKPDVWGTQHDPSADLGEVPLELEPAEEASDELRASIEETDEAKGEATLRLIWGPHAWTAPFRIVEPKQAASEG